MAQVNDVIRGVPKTTGVDPYRGDLLVPGRRWSALLYLYFSPTKVFEGLRCSPRWLWPHLLCIAALFGQIVLTSDQRMADMERQIVSSRTLSSDQIQDQLEYVRAMRSRGVTFQDYVKIAALAVVVQTGKLLGLALCLWLTVFMEPRVTFKAILSLCSMCFLVVIPEMLIRIPLIWTTGSKAVFFGPVLFLADELQHTPLHTALDQLDVFNVWMLILLIVGLCTVTGITRKRSVVTAVCLWLVWITIRSATGGLQDLL